MKKMMLISHLILALIFGGFIFLQLPLINSKLSTEAAIRGIENEFLKTDLTENENDRFQFMKGWVLGNQERSSRSNENARVAGLFVCFILFINNSILLFLGQKKGIYNNASKRTESTRSS
jgi:hypothetical protein